MSSVAVDRYNNEVDLDFYSYGRSPNYAIRFIEDAIETRPIVESQLIRYGLISSSSNGKNVENSRNSQSNTVRLNSEREKSVNLRNLWNNTDSDCGDSARSTSAVCTKTTLLRQKIITSKGLPNPRVCLKSNKSDSRPSSVHSAIANKYQYGFLVGARYTRQNFTLASTLKYRHALAPKKVYKDFLIGEPPDFVICDSPPNSPISEAAPLAQPIAEAQPHRPTKVTFTPSRPAPVVAPRSTLLPQVTGFSFLRVKRCIGTPFPSSVLSGHISAPPHDYSRAALNLHLARATTRRNRRVIPPANTARQVDLRIIPKSIASNRM